MDLESPLGFTTGAGSPQGLSRRTRWQQPRALFYIGIPCGIAENRIRTCAVLVGDSASSVCTSGQAKPSAYVGCYIATPRNHKLEACFHGRARGITVHGCLTSMESMGCCENRGNLPGFANIHRLRSRSMLQGCIDI